MRFQKPVWLWFSIFCLLTACASNEEQTAVTEPVPTATAVPATTTPLPNTPTPTTIPVRATAVPTPSQLGQPIAAAAQITVGDWSPDGRFLVIKAVNPEGGETLFILPVNSS